MALSRSMSAAVAGLKAHQTAMDVIGNNIANVNTYGFRSSTAMFRDVMYQTLAAGSAGVAGTAGGTNPSQIGYGSTVSAVETNSGATSMSVTNDSRDCYISGEGYFVIKNGTGYSYTRVGDKFTFDTNGYLTDGAGHLICGVNNGGTTDSDLAATFSAGSHDATKPDPIHYDPNPSGGAVTLSSISFGEDGTITAQKDGKAVVVGKIDLAYFPNSAGLTATGNSCYVNTSGNAGTATYSAPGSGSTGKLVTGALESSNVDLANEFSNMIQMERGFQANTKIVTVNDEMLQTLVNMKN